MQITMTSVGAWVETDAINPSLVDVRHYYSTDPMMVVDCSRMKYVSSQDLIRVASVASCPSLVRWPMLNGTLSLQTNLRSLSQALPSCKCSRPCSRQGPRQETSPPSPCLVSLSTDATTFPSSWQAASRCGCTAQAWRSSLKRARDRPIGHAHARSDSHTIYR